MKTLFPLLLASLSFLPLTVRAEVSAQAWLETYYLNPQPDTVPARIATLSREGFFDKSSNIALSIGFLATLISDNPQRVDGWLVQLRELPARHRRLLASALWQANHPAAGEVLKHLSHDSQVRADVLRLADTPAQLIADTPVRSASSMNLQWGAFLASGSDRHIVRILDGIGSDERGLDTVARAALARNAAAHPRVLATCRAQLERQPEEVREVLRAALQDAAVRPRT